MSTAVYAMREVSGAHFNPAITLAFAVRGSSRAAELPPYMLAQLAGATLAHGAFYAACKAGTLVCPPALLAEVAATNTLVCSVFLIGRAVEQGHLPYRRAPLTVGALAACLRLLGRGAGMNPAHSLGARLSLLLQGFAVPVVLAGATATLGGPLLGSLIGERAFSAILYRSRAFRVLRRRSRRMSQATEEAVDDASKLLEFNDDCSAVGGCELETVPADDCSAVGGCELETVPAECATVALDQALDEARLNRRTRRGSWRGSWRRSRRGSRKAR